MHAMGSVENFLRSKDDLKLASFGGGRPETRELKLTKQPSPLSLSIPSAVSSAGTTRHLNFRSHTDSSLFLPFVCFSKKKH